MVEEARLSSSYNGGMTCTAKRGVAVLMCISPPSNQPTQHTPRGDQTEAGGSCRRQEGKTGLLPASPGVNLPLHLCKL